MFAFKRLQPLLNRVVIKKVEPITKTKGGILLPEASTTQLNYGTVIETGPGKVEDGTLRAPLVKKGDTVMLPEYGGTKFTLADETEYFIYRDDDIIGLLHEWKYWRGILDCSR